MPIRWARTLLLLLTALAVITTGGPALGDPDERPEPPQPGAKSARKKTPRRPTPKARPADKEALAKQVDEYTAELRELETRGQAKEAVPVARKLLEARQQLSGPEHAETAWRSII